MTTAAFAPAHGSGLFAVHDEHPDPLRRGSRGAGWSLDLGATATAMAGHGRLSLDGRTLTPAELPVTRSALSHLTGADRVDMDLHLDLPVGQGFGMSAAGTLAACLAATHELGLEPEDALAAAHRAEVESGTGLGDVIGSWIGGAEVRVAPGIPPHGGALHVDAEADFVFCVMGEAIATPRIIRDETWKQRTREQGDAAVDRIVAARREAAWPAILAESHRFSLEFGLMPKAMRLAGEGLPAGTQWGQAMLGSTLWASGPPEALAQAARELTVHGTVVKARLDGRGARLVRPRAGSRRATAP